MPAWWPACSQPLAVCRRFRRGNEIASQNVQQLQKLRDPIATQINMQGNYMAQQQDRVQLDDALRQQRRSGTITQTGSNKGY